MTNVIYSIWYSHPMRRKVIRQGHNTLTVTLPARWSAENKVKPGDELEINEENGSVIISPIRLDTAKRAEIKVMKPARLISRSICNLYRIGVDEISITYDDPIVIKDINAKLPLLMGFEITAQDKEHTVLHNVMRIDDKEFGSSFRRYFLLTKTLAEESLKAAKNRRFNEMEGLCELENAQNRLYMFLSRCVNKVPGIVKQPQLMYLLIHRLEDIADDYKYICRFLAVKRVALSPAAFRHFGRVNRMLGMVYDLYYEFNIEVGQDIINSKKEVIMDGLAMLETAPRKELQIIHLLNNLCVKIFEASSPIFGLRTL